MLFKNDNLHLLDYWRVLSKRRYAAIIVFAFIVGIVTVYSFVATPVYKGSAQILINLGSMVALFPLTGVPLPFISYGGSNLIISMFAMGIVINISKYAVKKK